MSTRPDTSPDACPLCQPAGESLLWQDERLRVIAVTDGDIPGYIRVIWRAHVAEMTDLSATDRTHLMHTIYQIEAQQRALLKPDKINLASLGNQVPHLHWHLIPRWRSDPYFPGAIWAPASTDTTRQQPWQTQCAELAAQINTLHLEIQRTLSQTAQVPPLPIP